MSKQEQKDKKQQKRGGKPKKKAQKISSGIAHIQSTYNNTIVTITDRAGNVISWFSAGKAKFLGAKKSSAFAATIVGKRMAEVALSLGIQEVEAHLKGIGVGRESAVRGLASGGLQITEIRECTPIPHNGCRAKKCRRV